MRSTAKAAHSPYTTLFRSIPELSAALGVMRKNEGIPRTEWNKEDQEIFSNASDKPDYEKCVAISTKASIREMLAPGLLAVMVPVLFGFLGGPDRKSTRLNSSHVAISYAVF